jgi:hypothetical protein
MLDRLFGLAGPTAIGAARNEQRILEPGGRYEARARAFAGKNRIVDDGRAMQEQTRLSQELLQRQPHIVCRDTHRVENAARELRRRRERLAEADRITLAERHAIRAGPTHIDGEYETAGLMWRVTHNRLCRN